MKTNLDTICELIDYIDSHLDEKLDLDNISKEMCYSKYHLSRMFSSIVGFSIHNYVKRRRLTEAARLLIFSDKPIIEIALFAGYDNQQSFTTGFKALFKSSPNTFRKKKDFYPLQLKFKADGKSNLRGDKIMKIDIINSDKILLVGFRKNTRFGFFAIGQCWRKIHSKKQLIQNRKNTDFLIGLNDYTKWDYKGEKQPAFDYYAASEVENFNNIPKGMESKELPPSKYVVFSFRAKSEDSLQPVSDYIYKEWFPESTCQLNESAKYDFARYGEDVDNEGKSLIEYWVPIL